MSDFRLHSIHKPTNKGAVADIIFIHGLGGDPFGTWKKDDNFWPEWLSEVFPATNIWTLSHPSTFFASMLSGKGMSVLEMGRVIVSYFEAKDIGINRPVIFIVHSLGGILIKAALRKASDMVGGSNNCPLVQHTAGIAFLATPHDGSSFANAAKLLNNFCNLKFNKVVLELEKDNSFLDDLNNWYKGCVEKNIINNFAAYETVKYLNKAQIVSAKSADPNVSKCYPIPVNASHTDICKFDDKEDSTYIQILKFLKDILPNDSLFDEEDYDNYYTTRKPGDRLSLHDKLEKGSRIDEYELAERSKEKITKRLKRYTLLNSSIKEQEKFISDVYDRFDLSTKELINNNESKQMVNNSILEKVVDPIVNNGNTFFDEKATSSDVRDALYFLTGNCHIKWSAD